MVIFIAHGSRDPDWRASVEAVIDAVAAELGPGRVGLAYMDCAPPTLGQVAAQAVADGARRIDVAPLFLADQGHVDRDIRPLVEELRDALGGVEVQLLPSVGQHPRFRDVLRDIALTP